jgi:hypothetical protein
MQFRYPRSRTAGAIAVSTLALLASCWVILGVTYFLGLWVPVQDSKFTQLGICLHDEQLNPVETVATSISRFYVCGMVEGTTYRTGTMYIFYEDTVVFQESLKVQPGAFFLTLTPQRFAQFQPGNYRIEIGYQRQVLIQTEFTVIF